MEGLSLKKIWTDLVRSVIVMLYLLDNDTSWMILISSGIGTAIEVWKVLKAIDIQVEWSNTVRVYTIPIRFPLVFSYCDSYENSETQGETLL